MATDTLLTEHGNNARDRTGEPQQNVNPYNGEKHGVSRGYFDSRYIRDSIVHCIPR